MGPPVVFKTTNLKRLNFCICETPLLHYLKKRHLLPPYSLFRDNNPPNYLYFLDIHGRRKHRSDLISTFQHQKNLPRRWWYGSTASMKHSSFPLWVPFTRSGTGKGKALNQIIQIVFLFVFEFCKPPQDRFLLCVKNAGTQWTVVSHLKN